jgi:hypothetical protein
MALPFDSMNEKIRSGKTDDCSGVVVGVKQRLEKTSQGTILSLDAASNPTWRIHGVVPL